jgi:peptide/nickel transport system ATP-binding protein
MEPILSVRDLNITYHTREGTLPAVRHVSFEVNPGEIVGIAGESGCGKSTVASAILGLLPPNGKLSGGEIIFKGRNLAGLPEESLRSLRGNELAMIFQDPLTSLNPVFTIETQMLDAQRAHDPGASTDELRRRAVNMLARVGIPDAAERLRNYPHEFSGGMRQRILIATALLTNPALLIADEPTSALDVTLEAQILDLLKGLRDELGTAILYISHDLGVMAQLCDRMVVMYAGNVVETGDVYAMFDRPRHPYTQDLLRSHPAYTHKRTRLASIPGQVPSLFALPGGCKFHPRCRLAQAVCREVEPRLIPVTSQRVLCHLYDPEFAPLMTGAPREEATPPAGAAFAPEGEGEAFVSARDVRVHFADRVGALAQLRGARGGVLRAVDGVTITIGRGATFGLVGESGSGKTTLGRALLRLIDLSSGEAEINGMPLSRLAESQLRPVRAQMQMIFQDPRASLSPRMKVSDILLEPFRIHHVPARPETVEELLSLVGLSAEQATKYPHELSGGQARRVGIARALSLNPSFLVADEPTAGLDVSVAASILNLLQDLRERLQLTYMIITHNLNVIGFIADRVGVMYLGKLVEVGATRDIFENPAHPYTEALISAIAVPDPRLRDKPGKRIVLKGEIPSPRNPPPGCPFHPRCLYAQEICTLEMPPLRPLPTGQLVACHFPLTGAANAPSNGETTAATGGAPLETRSVESHE